MNKLIIIFIALMAITSLCAIPYAVLGNINMPDAYVLPNKMIEISYTNYIIADGQILEEPGGDYESIEADPYNFSVSMSVGLLDRLEVGLVAAKEEEDIMYGNLKLNLYNETEKFPAVSIGIENLFSDVQMRDDDELYMVGTGFSDPQDYIKNSPYISASKSTLLLSDVPYFEHLETTIHFGMGLRRFEGLRETVKQLHGFFGGVDLKPSKYVSFNGEVDSQNLNLGINLYYKNFTVRSCIYRLEDMFKENDNDQYGQKFAVGIKYTLDSFSEVKAADKNKSFQYNVSPKVKKRSLSKSLSEAEAAESTEETNPLLEELRLIRERRKQAEKELEEIRKLLQE